MKSALLSPVGLVAAIVSLIFIAWPATRYGVGLWEPFTPEILAVDLWTPPGAKVLNEPGPIKVTEAKIQAPTVIHVKDREAFAAGAQKADRVELVFMPGTTKNGNNDVVSCVNVCYVAHGEETTYLLWETPLAPNGKGRRGRVAGESFSFLAPRTLLWHTEEHPRSSRAIACVVIGVGVLAASFLTFLILWGVWSSALTAIEEHVRRRKPPLTA